MIASLLLAGTAVDAERAFAARAQEVGQWRAFAEYAEADAVMFVPEPVQAQAWLKDRPEPPRAVEWWPSESYVSFDGATAVNTGPWRRTASEGYFTTVWRKGESGWRWVYDGGDALATPRPQVAEPKIERASCARAPVSAAPAVPADGKHGGGSSRDRSLLWRWQIDADGARHFTAQLWTGTEYRTVIEDVATAG